jgi:phasin family protein
MARHEEKTEDAARRVREQAAEQPRRIGLAAAEATEEIAKTSADLILQNAEFFRNTWRFGADVASSMVGLSGNESQEASERSARNAETILYSATAMSKGLNGASQEYFQMVRRRLETNMDHLTEFWRCRTPHDVMAVQSDLIADALHNILESNRRMADLSLKLSEDAARHVTQNLERMKRAA